MIALILAAGVVSFSGTQPQLAASGERVFVAFGTGSAIAVARSADGGATFAEPVTIPVQGVMALGRHRGLPVHDPGHGGQAADCHGQAVEPGPPGRGPSGA